MSKKIKNRNSTQCLFQTLLGISNTRINHRAIKRTFLSYNFRKRHKNINSENFAIKKL